MSIKEQRDKRPKGHKGPKGQGTKESSPLCLFCPLGLLSLFVKFFSLFAFLIILASCGRSHEVYRAPQEEKVVAYTPPPLAPPPVRRSLDILLDAGHGGKDQGAHKEGKITYEEKSLTLITTKMVGRYLMEMGYRVSLTRRDDTFLELQERVDLADKRRPKIFVSIHYNSAPSVKAHGIEVFYYKGEEEDKRSRTSKILAEDVLKEMIAATEARSRGVKNGNLHVIRENSFPAILIEAGFLSNKEERERIYTKEYQEQLAKGIAKGIDAFLKR